MVILLRCLAASGTGGSPDNRPLKNYEVHYVTSTRDNEETSLRMMVDKAYELMDKRTQEKKSRSTVMRMPQSMTCMFERATKGFT